MNIRTEVEVDNVYEQSAIYHQFVNDILERTPVLKTVSLTYALHRTFKALTTKNVCMGILKDMQAEDELFLSDDGFCIKSNAIKLFYYPSELKYAFQRDKGNWIHSFKDRFDKLSIDQKNRVDSFCLVASLMPDAEAFTGDSTMWDYMYTRERTEEKDDRLYEIVKISKEEVDTKCELLKLVPPIENEDIQRKTIRFALIDDPSYAWKIPKIGFTKICVLDKTKASGFSVYESRKFDDAWSGQELYKAMRKKYLEEIYK